MKTLLIVLMIFLPILVNSLQVISMMLQPILMHVQSNNSECKFSFHDIDDEFLLKQLLSLDVKKATG